MISIVLQDMLAITWIVTIISVLQGSRSLAVETNGRVISGESARRGEFPMFVLIEHTYVENNLPEGTRCGGSIIHKRVVLTAADCFRDSQGLKDSKIFVYAGVHNMERPNEPYVAVKVKKAVKHRLWDQNRGPKYNIALLFLEKNLKYSRKVQPVTLSDSEFDKFSYRSDNCFIVGVGLNMSSESRYQEYPKVVQKANVNVTRNSVCNALYDSFAYIPYRKKYRLTRDRICTATKGGQGACYGDLGGPMGCYDKKGVFRQVGIMSYFATNDCLLSLNGHTRVSFFRNWISRKMNKYLPNRK